MQIGGNRKSMLWSDGLKTVYVVKPEAGEGPQRTLYRDLLLPCGFLPVTAIREHSSPIDTSKKRRLKDKTTKNTQEDVDCQEDESCSYEDDLYPSAWVPEGVLF